MTYRIAQAGLVLGLAACAAGCHDAINPGGNGGGGSGDMAQGGPPDGGADMANPSSDMKPAPDLMPPPDLGGVLDPGWVDPTGQRSLSNEGSSDWVHWGLSSENSVDRRAGSIPAITAEALGPNILHQYNDNHVTFDWSGGSPTANAVSTPTGIFILGVGNGFRVTAPAEPTMHTLRIYMSAFGADYHMIAHVSDNSAPDYMDDLINTVMVGGVYRMYTFNYKSNTPGQTFTVTWVNTMDHYGGANVTLQAATLQ
jgi:hypothetical protein